MSPFPAPTVELFERMVDVPGVRLISLQKQEGASGGPALAAQAGPTLQAEAESSFALRASVVELGEFDTVHGAFMDTAAVMMNLDLVITSDTSVAHLAGALGVSVWVALPYVPDWRWLLEREDSPWYPTMRLFRQKKAGDWEGVFERIREALRGRLER